MNRQIHQLYRQLPENLRKEFKLRFKDSPVALSFLDFLNQCEQDNFKNREVVEWLYPTEKNAAYSSLENRYFKLRKKILVELEKIETGDEDHLPAQEIELMRCKQLVFSNQKDAAFQRLVILERECWEKNIFEILPGIIDQIIFINQSFNRLEKNSEVYVRFKKAIELQADVYEMIYLARSIYEIHFKKGISAAGEELKRLNELGEKHAEYPRFRMCYHNISLYYKLASIDFRNQMETIAIHHTEYKKLAELYPNVLLVSYRNNYSQYQNFHFKQITSFLHFNKLEFEAAHAAMDELYHLVNKSGSIYSVFKSETIYLNMVHMQWATGRYKQAVKTSEAYLDFIRENNLTEKILLGFIQQAIIAVESLNPGKNQIEFYLEKLDSYIRAARHHNNVQTSIGEAVLIRARLLLLSGEYQKACSALEKTECIEFLTSFGIEQFYSDFFAHFKEFSTRKNSESRALSEELTGLISSVKSPEAYLYLNWCKRFMVS